MEIAGKSINVREKLLFPICQRIGLPGPARHSCQHVGDAFNLCITRQPILLRHQRQPGTRGDRQLVKPDCNRSIDRVTILIQWPMMQGGPVLGQQVVVENIDEHSGVSSPVHRDSRTAPPKGRLRFGKAVYGTMQGNAPCQIVRQRAGQGAFDPISDDPAHDQGGIVACKKCMGQEIQCCSFRERRALSGVLGAKHGKLAKSRNIHAAVRAVRLLVVFRRGELKDIIFTGNRVAMFASLDIAM